MLIYYFILCVTLLLYAMNFVMYGSDEYELFMYAWKATMFRLERALTRSRKFRPLVWESRMHNSLIYK